MMFFFYLTKKPSHSAPLPSIKYSDSDIPEENLSKINEIKRDVYDEDELEKLMTNEIDKLIRERIKNQSVVDYGPDVSFEARLNEFLQDSEEDSEPGEDNGEEEKQSKKRKVNFKNFNLERLVGQGAFGKLEKILNNHRSLLLKVERFLSI
jgi:hypothetical protein